MKAKHSHIYINFKSIKIKMRRSKIYLRLDVDTGTRETLEMAFGRKELGKVGL